MSCAIWRSTSIRNCRSRSFPEGIVDDQIDSFLEGADVYVDAIDIFALEMRRKIYARCRALGIHAVLSVPAGMGTAFLIFSPTGMSLEEWFRFEDVEPAKRLVNFIVGVTPAGLHRSYLVDRSSVNLETRDFPSTGLACELCAGVTAAQTVENPSWPRQDRSRSDLSPFRRLQMRLQEGPDPGGNRNWLQRIKLALGYREFAKSPNPRLGASADLFEEGATSGNNRRLMDPGRFAAKGGRKPHQAVVPATDHAPAEADGPT